MGGEIETGWGGRKGGREREGEMEREGGRESEEEGSMCVCEGKSEKRCEREAAVRVREMCWREEGEGMFEGRERRYGRAAG